MDILFKIFVLPRCTQSVCKRGSFRDM